ncbi:MAG: PhoH family protein [Coriobacteriales bacterium]
MDSTQARLTVPSTVDPIEVCGVNDANLRAIERGFPQASITVHGDTISIAGASSDVQALMSLFTDLFRAVRSGETPTVESVEATIGLLRTDAFSPAALRDDILLTYRGRAIRPKTTGQKRYVDAIRSHTITFGLGPAGTGKTYLAMAMAVAALKRKEVGRIVLTRPVVEAGESLGFLPGTLEEKVDPYVRPLYDALFDMTDPERGGELVKSGVIEIAPLAFMRGRTLNDAFVILDEAQNTTSEQMKMFLTRLGFGSRFVITGDFTQTDLPRGRSSLEGLRQMLGGIDDIAFVDLSPADIVRHSLVAKIVAAYEAAEGKRRATGREGEM